ncbi:MAG: M3 family metallopeptidase [Candidatus Aminicenantes bacterium]|nr:M3 family metallopeptidase [Candidatus Aminicenantes bacterium]
MKKILLFSIFVGVLFWACAQQSVPPPEGNNPFFGTWETPFETPPFDIIKETDFMPAFIAGIDMNKAEIALITESTKKPNFKNTIEALDKSGVLLTKVDSVFSCLNGANTNDEIQQIARDVTPLLSKHQDDILLNATLFEKVKAVYEKKDSLNLNVEQNTLLEETYKAFVRGGANLDKEKQAELRGINEELSNLTLKFGQNILKEDNAFQLVIDNKVDLVGLPDAVIAGAAEAATALGHEGKWAFTLHKPSWIPFLQYSEKRDLREKIYKAYYNRGNNDNELDNKVIAAKIAALRVQRANLLGYKTHAHFVLEENMAKVPENVYELLNQLWEPALRIAKKEAEEMQAIIEAEGNNFKLESWDWWYYAEQLKKAKYALEDEVLRPYFKLENVIDGVFMVATNLYGLQFEERMDIPKYHEDVKVFEVKEADGSHVGILYTDYFPRPSKRGGAWMNSLRKQSRIKGKNITPVIYNVGNFTKPTVDKPSLISLEDVGTLFHEFGHALHGLLSDCSYETLSGTAVSRDFVELPSQIMENWALHPDVLKMYAKHYETGESIPQELIDKITNAGHFNQGFISVEYLAASILDMDWHTLTEAKEQDVWEFENASMNKIGLIPEIISRYKTPYFNHIFSGGYSSGYYSYIWAEVLDADAFDAFKETSLFDQETANSFRKNILAAGGTEDPMTLYVRFRGSEPKVEPLLKKRGLK